MALGDRKIPEVFNKKTGGSKDARSITSERELEIKAEYDAGVHVADDGMFNTIAPALYAIQKLSEDIDELRRYITAEITSITSSQASAITANTAKTGISTSQASAITANTAKTGITSTQASRITANTAKTGITSTQASQITANNAKVGTETDLSITEGLVLKATVAESRGVYTLTFTMTTEDGRTTKTANITMS